MRIIGGTFGGRRLAPVPGSSTRPTAERVREALFSRLESRYGLKGIVVLDLFAGTGALALEALSRGARRAVCVERSEKALAVLRRNVEALEAADAVHVVRAGASEALERLAQAGETFTGVFVDPPYGSGLVETVLADLDRLEVVEAGGWVSVEADRRLHLPAAVNTLAKVREDCYGDSKLALYERQTVCEGGT